MQTRPLASYAPSRDPRSSGYANETHTGLDEVGRTTDDPRGDRGRKGTHQRDPRAARRIRSQVRVAALYVETGGAYYGLDDVDPWDEARDARLYAGPWPVVAHPPCTRWSLLGLCRNYYDGDDGGCFEAALCAVRRYGGVLEHPRHTLAWKTFGLPRPSIGGWSASLWDGGWATEVDQGLYGHPVHKPTWLYLAGTDRPPELLWGSSDRPRYVAKRYGGGPANSKRGALRSRTPESFRDVLLAMARDTQPSLAVLASQQRERARVDGAPGRPTAEVA